MRATARPRNKNSLPFWTKTKNRRFPVSKFASQHRDAETGNRRCSVLFTVLYIILYIVLYTALHTLLYTVLYTVPHRVLYTVLCTVGFSESVPLAMLSQIDRDPGPGVFLEKACPRLGSTPTSNRYEVPSTHTRSPRVGPGPVCP